LIHEGVPEESICIVAQTSTRLKDYMRMLREKGIRYYEIKGGKIDDSHYQGIRVAAMHRVKGLDFRVVFVVATDVENVITLGDPLEKCLLYVALTRAQEKVYITSYK